MSPEGIPQKFKITKQYGRKVSANFQSYSFDTVLETEVEVKSGKELTEASDRLFQQAKWLTEQDIANTFTQDNNGETNA